MIRKSGAKLELSCRGGHRVRVNGEERSSARLEIGDVIELAGHQLTIAEAPGGFDVAIELRPNENIDASEFESAFRTDLKQTWLSKRPAAWLLTTIVLILGVVLPVSVMSCIARSAEDPHGCRAMSSGTAVRSSPAHQQAAGVRCDTCHKEPFVRCRMTRARAATRRFTITCRLNIWRKRSSGRRSAVRLVIASTTSRRASSSTAAIRCASIVTRIRAEVRLSCTWSRSAALARSDHPEFKAQLLKPTAIAAGSGFEIEWKPEIVALDKAVEQSNVKFSHNQHLDRDRVLRRATVSRSIAPTAIGSSRTASTSSRSRWRTAVPLPRAHVRPRRARATAAARQAARSRADAAGLLHAQVLRSERRPSTRERRRMPGHDEEEQTCSGPPFDCAMRSAHAAIEDQFKRRGCVGCHGVEDTRARATSTASRSTRSASRATTSRPAASTTQPPDPGQADRRCSMPVVSQGEEIAGQQDLMLPAMA